MNSITHEYNTKFSFLVHWYNYDTSLMKRFRLSFYPYDNTLELFDLDTSRLYLRRTQCENVHLKDLFVRNRVRVHGRQLEIEDYIDAFTRDLVTKDKELNLVLVKPKAVRRIGEIVSDIWSLNYQISQMKMCQLNNRQALDFYADRRGDVWLPFIVQTTVAGPIMALELHGENAVERFKEELGPVDPETARRERPHSLRAKFGTNRAFNAFHSSASLEKAIDEARYFFPLTSDRKAPKPTANFANCTCCIIKPHAIAEGHLGHILSSINDHGLFKITGLQMIHLTNPEAEEFVGVYRGIVNDYCALLMSLLGGPCVVLEVSAEEGVDVQQQFRKFVGPADPLMARKIRPKTLRAIYGVDKYQNALHCTDLPEDALLEIEYFFKGAK